uniref:F-box domain-containing protein n=1 Tax=Panagrellus redivivus TaxID=6233 RepID=A0A7E4W3B0_PANRE
MTTAPQLKNHLIRELMHTICFKKSGDAMVLLALSGKEPFSVFRYVVENRAHAYTLRGGIFIKCSSPYTSLSVRLECETEAAKRLIIRFVRDLDVDSPSSTLLPFDKITNLTVRRCGKPLSSIRVRWTDLEVLKMCDIPDAASNGFFKDFMKTHLPNLRKLEVGLTLKGCNKLLTMTPRVPLPEDVTLLLTVCENALANFGSLNTFPEVKHFTATVQCFTGIETAKIALSTDHHPGHKEFEKVFNFHEWLRNTKFSVPVEIDFTEKVDIAYNFDIGSVYTQLKSIGFEEDDFVFHLIVKEYGNVKLVHRLEHYDSTSD